MKKHNNLNNLKYITFILFWAFCSIYAMGSTVVRDTLHVSHTQRTSWPYILVLPNGATPERLADSIFYDIANGIIFPVNKYVMRSDDPWLRELQERIKPWAENNRLWLRYIDVRGSSSPEGPIPRNDFLAEARSRALQQKLDSIFDISTIPIRVEGHAEDWNALIFMMQRDDDPDLPAIKRILSEYAGRREVIKQKIKAVQGGRLWQRVFDKYFAQIRYARVVLYFERIDPEEPKPPMPIAIDLPDTVMADEIISAIERLDTLTLDMPEQPVTTDRFPRQHILGIRTNVLYDLMFMPRYGFAPTPNLSLEFYPKVGHFTYNVSVIYPDWERWSEHKFWQIQDFNLGVRYYTRRTKKAPRDIATDPRAHTIADRFIGFFVGAYYHNNRYGIGFDKDTGWEGEGWGAGVQIGYTLPLCKSYRWRLEFTLGAGYYTCKYDPYVWGNPVNGNTDGKYYYDYTGPASQFIRRNHRFRWFGPTEVGIHLTYDLLYRRGNGKKGVSFKRWGKEGSL